MLKLHNTLTGKTEEFKSITAGKVGMYNCGPTVYNFAHIGNLRAYVFADVLRRSLEYTGYTVTQIMNITDVGHLVGDGDEGDDKMTKALIREGKPKTRDAMREVANTYFEAFKQDLEKLNIETPTQFPFASEHIQEDIDLISVLFEKDIAYQISDGIYFDLSKFPEYGKLGNIKQETVEETESRIGINSEKKNYRDFALWKFNDAGWETPWGKGFPGWHIECSAMSMKYLGETFDIHTGGIDHIPTHHNNEIAQSESATGKPYAHYWLHSAHVQVDGGKMAKSENNFITLQTLIDKKFSPLAYRYWLLQARYSSPVNFSWEALEAAQQAYNKLTTLYHSLPDNGKPVALYLTSFTTLIEDDLDTAKSIALLWELAKDDTINPADKKSTIQKFNEVLGFDFNNQTSMNQKIQDLPFEIQALIEYREEVRKNKDFKTSDNIRNELKEKGYLVEDKPDGPQISLI